MDLSRRQILSGALGAGSVLGLSACGFGAGSSDSGTPTKAPTKASTGPVKGNLTFSFWGGSDGETSEQVQLIVAENVRRLLDGRPLVNQVDRVRGY